MVRIIGCDEPPFQTRDPRLRGLTALRARCSPRQKVVALGEQGVAILVQTTDRWHPEGGCTEQVQSTTPDGRQEWEYGGLIVIASRRQAARRIGSVRDAPLAAGILAGAAERAVRHPVLAAGLSCGVLKGRPVSIGDRRAGLRRARRSNARRSQLRRRSSGRRASGLRRRI